MKLEPIIQSEVSQKEKHQYGILTHIYGIEKDGNDNPVYETAKETLIYRSLLDSVEKGEGGMIWENRIETVGQGCAGLALHGSGHKTVPNIGLTGHDAC